MSLENIKRRLGKKMADEMMGEVVQMLMAKIDELINEVRDVKKLLQEINDKMGDGNDK